MAAWTPQAWRGKPLRQVPTYPDQKILDEAEVTLRAYPPLVFAGEVDTLRDRLAGAAAGGAARARHPWNRSPKL